MRNRGRRRLAMTVGAVVLATSVGAEDATWLDPYRQPASRILAATRDDRAAWNRLAELTDTFGPRLSGTPQLEAAYRWAAAEMRADGFDNVRLEKVMVPTWVRGRESAEIVEPFPSVLAMLGLGNSVGTPPDGIAAEILVVKSAEDLEARAPAAKGKIVVFNVPYTGYGATVRYRSAGASMAAKHGAVAMLLRSVGLPGLRTPHTGSLHYADGVPRIPAAAVSGEDADRLQRMSDRGQKVRVRLLMEAHFLPDSESANLIAELPGRERPQEIVLMGGHLDSWDVGVGAIDDGGGCVAAWEALRVLKRLGLRPRRTIRVVFWTNEENGLRGGLAYRDQHRAELADHVLAMESDGGVFRPRGFGFSGNDKARAAVAQIASLLSPIGADHVGPTGGGADIGPAVAEGNIPAMSLDVEGAKYFLYHHTAADTPDKIDPEEIALSTASLAVMSYVVADMPTRLGR
ncbi:MAG TPA: M28 family metallopeptidase [Vicinamibacteria bacterium]|nr:M28 family metallopeptidase [Vicinamibacteria bacterium]